LGERLNGIQEVGGSTPPGSTKFFLISLLFWFVQLFKEVASIGFVGTVSAHSVK
jgi:hypothetical protein